MIVADGEIIIETDIDTKKARTELKRLETRIEGLKEKIDAKQTARNAIAEKLKAAAVEAEEARKAVELLQAEVAQSQRNLRTEDLSATQRKQMSDELRYQTTELNRQQRSLAQKEATLTRLETQERQMTSDIAHQTQSLDKSQRSAEALTNQIQKSSGAGATMRQQMEGAADSVNRFKRRLSQLAKQVLIFTVAARALSALRDWLGGVIKSNDELSAKMAKLKGAFLTAVQPILNAVIPAFSKLLDVLTRVVSAVASVVSLFFGTTAEAAADQAEDLNREQEAIEGVGSAAKTAAKQLAAFDTINQLTNNGGAGGAGNQVQAPDFSAVKDYKLPDWLEKLVEIIKFNVDDVFFNWGDLTAEDIAKKAVTGLITLCSGAAGFAIGGVPGAIVGTLLGVTISGLVNNLIFDNDGKLSKREIAKMVVYALSGLAGGIIGFTIGGFAGAMIGATIGIGLTLLIEQFGVSQEKKALERFYASDLGKLVQQLNEDISKHAQLALDLKAHVDSITGEVDAKTQADFTMAKTLIEQIFSIDAKDNKTAEEIQRIQALCKDLNKLGILGDFRLEWDASKKSVSATKDEVYKVMDAQFKLLQQEAWKDSIIQLLKDQAEYEQALDKAYATAGRATREYYAKLDQGIQVKKDNLFQYGRELHELKAAMESADKAASDLNSGYIAVQEKINDFSRRLGYDTKAVTDWSKKYSMAAEDAADNLKKNAAQKAPDVKAAGESIVGAFADGIASSVEKSAQAARSVTGQVTQAFSSAYASAKNAGKGLTEQYAEGIKAGSGTAKTAMSNVMQSLLSITQSGVSAIRDLIDKINTKLQTKSGTQPDLSALLDKIVGGMKGLKIPHLAQGAVIPANREFMAVLGDQKSGTNIETPLETMVQAFRQALAESGGRGDRSVYLMLDRRELGRAILDAGDQERVRVGLSLT